MSHPVSEVKWVFQCLVVLQIYLNLGDAMESGFLFLLDIEGFEIFIKKSPKFFSCSIYGLLVAGKRFIREF